jgi:hypothetical protein
VTDRARDLLEVTWSPGIVPGIAIYGIRAAGSGGEPDFPKTWLAYAESDAHLLVGPGWEVPMWDLHVRVWPPQAEFDALLRASLQAMLDAGCSVAWVSDELGFISPPELFDPDRMFDGVLVALTSETGLLGTLELDEPLRFLGRDDLLELRELTRGLSDAPAW